MVHAGHLGGLPADEGTPGLHASVRDALDDTRGGLDVELAAGEVVKEVQRLRTLHQEVVHGHRHEVDACKLEDQPLRSSGGQGSGRTDKVVQAHFQRNTQLRADTVRAADEDGVSVPGGLQVEHTSEPADLSIGTGTARCTNVGLDGLYQRIASID